MRAASALDVRAGIGIRGDANAAPESPRQVLLADAAVYRDLGLPEASLRQNLLVDGLENADPRSGDLLRAQGTGVLLRVTFLCEPCVKLNQVRPELASEVLGRRGVLARVVAGGRIRPGHELVLVREQFSPIPERVRDRILRAVSGIPPGKVASFKHITRMAGVPKSYVRALPRILMAAPPGVPGHRAVSAAGNLMTAQLPGQAGLLEAEGLTAVAGRVTEAAIWVGDPYGDEERVVLRRCQAAES